MVPPSSFLAQALSWDWMWIETSSDADCDDQQATSGRLPHLPSVSAYYPVTTHQRPCVPTRHTTGIERPWCVDRLPSHISKMVVSTVCVGGPE